MKGLLYIKRCFDVPMSSVALVLTLPVFIVTSLAIKAENDPRITKVGRFIRRTCIDELPQLINCIKGDMSIVGPIPLPTYEYISEQEEYGTAYNLRYTVPQGLTCIWQISNRSEVYFEKRMQMDC